MRFLDLLSATLRHYRRSALVIALGVAAATAVMTGALVVGDSVRGSLLAMTRQRLQKIDFVLSGGRFFRYDLAAELARHPSFGERFGAIVPGLVLRGGVEKPGAEPGSVAARAGRAQVYGIDDGWKALAQDGTVPALSANEAALSQRLALSLGVKPGDEVLLTLELPTPIPKDSLLGEKDDTAEQIPLKVKEVLSEGSSWGRFGLSPSQQVPISLFVRLDLLQDRLELSAARATRRQAARISRVNGLFVTRKDPSASISPDDAARLDELVHRLAALEDFNLRLVDQSQRGYLSLESEQMYLDECLGQAAEGAGRQLGGGANLPRPVSPGLIYLINEANAGKGEKAYAMYSAIAGLDANVFDSRTPAPFGGFQYVGAPLERPLANDEILLNEWMAQDLQAVVGDTVKLTYHISGSRGELPETSTSFKLAGIVSLKEGAGNDRGLVPEVPGITNADSLADWNQPFPMKLDRITSRDDEYWDEYRATPKMFISLASARELFRNRYGALTSVRVAIPAGMSVNEARDRLARSILDFVQPEQLGLSFRDIRAEGLKSAGGSNDFGGLFIGFSFFLIVAAAILVALLFRLAIEQRPQQVGLLVAVGFRPESVRRLLLAEAFVISVIGVVCGLVLAAAYSRLVIYGLTTWWIGAVGTNQLRLHLHPATLVLGGGISLPLGMLATWWGLRGLTKVSARGLLSGATEVPETDVLREARRRQGLRNAVLAGVPALCCVLVGVLGALPETEAFGGLSIRIVGFFVSGLLGLTALIALFGYWLAGNESWSVRGSGFAAALRMGLRNTGRQRLRSTMSAGMIAVATFLIVAIAAGKKNPAVETPALNSGNGGFSLVAETEIPVLYDITTAEGREKLNLAGEDAAPIKDAVRQIIPFRVQPGEDASCTNIFQTSQPTILGVPDDMERRGGFRFVGAGSGNPWARLRSAPEDTSGIVPVFGDMNTLQYSLHVGPGAILELRDANNQPFKARIDGMFDGSVFQGVLLMSEANFQRLYPGRVGFQYFLVDTPVEKSTEVGRWLESRVPGLDVDRVGDRLSDFLAVQNTYLSTFQALGGLGLLLGTLGLGTVLLRNVLERRAEIALLRAVGHTPGGLAVMVLGENLLVLAAGLGMGTLAALMAMLPQILGVSADVAWLTIFGQLALVLGVGVLASWWAVRAAAATPIVGSLRGE